MKRLLQVYGIETTEIPEGGMYGGPPVPRRASEGSYRPETSAPPLPHHHPDTVGQAIERYKAKDLLQL